MGDRKDGARDTHGAVTLKQRLRFGDADIGPELERGLAQLRAIHLAAAQPRLTPAQHAAFAAFMSEVTLSSLGCTGWSDPA